MSDPFGSHWFHSENTVRDEECAGVLMCFHFHESVCLYRWEFCSLSVKRLPLKEPAFFILMPEGWAKVWRVCLSIPGHCVCVFLYLPFCLIPFFSCPVSLHHPTLPCVLHPIPPCHGKQKCSPRLCPMETRNRDHSFFSASNASEWYCRHMGLSLFTQSQNHPLHWLPTHQLNVLPVKEMHFTHPLLVPCLHRYVAVCAFG